MDILVIGNGFDLAHGLKTSYKDFLEACHKMSLQEPIEGKTDYKKLCDCNLWMKHFITRQKQLGNTWIDLENEIYTVIKKIEKICRQNYLASGKVLTLEKRINDFNILTIEKFLRDTSWGEQLCKDGYINPCNPSYIHFYIQTYQDFVTLLYGQLREFTQAFEQYIIQDVLTQITPTIKYDFSLQPQTGSVHVLSFNYTDTYEKLYKRKSIYADPKSVYVYIHGKASTTEGCNLVLGTHSFYNYLPNALNENIPVEFNVFKKHNQRHRYGTIEAYQNFLKLLTDPKRVIKPVFHVSGHSLDKTDHKILKHVFLANKNAIINIYYHDEESQERLINNITEIIEEDEVMTKVRLIYQHDEIRGLLRRHENNSI